MAPSETFGMLDDPQVIAYRKKLQNLAETPEPKNQFDYDQWIMASVHFTLLNAVEAVYKNATHITEGDLSNYIQYALTASEFILQHHETEETVWFPRLSGKIDMEVNIHQHETFIGGVTAVIELLKASDPTRPDAIPFSPSTLRGHFDECMILMCQHLAEEIDTFAPDILRANFDEAYLKETHRLIDVHRRAHTVATIDLPFLMYSTLPEYGFPPAPWLIKKAVPLFAIHHWGWWKYSWTSKKWEQD